MNRLTWVVLIGMIALLIIGSCATQADARTRYTPAPRELGWYWWPEVTR
jgi:hypothetical protein